MDIVHLRCTSQACSGKSPCAKHCRATLVLNSRGGPIVPPPADEDISAELKTRMVRFLPHLCNKARTETCELEVAVATPEFRSHVEYFYEALLDTVLAFDARIWVKNILRYTDDVPEVVRQALRATKNDSILDLVIEGRNQLWATTATRQLA